MTYWYTSAGRLARLQSLIAIAIATAACNAADRLTQPSSPSATPVVSSTGLSFAASFRGGIPFGAYALPTSEFGPVYNGALRNIWPEFLLDELAEIKSRGGRVVLMFAGNEEHYKDGQGHFDFAKWKARVVRFKEVDFSSFISDGTIIGHYLIDEPYDPYNWQKPIPGAVIEELARYSKELWPTLVTIVRAQPNQVKWNGTYRYLDAAWAQYTYQKGGVETYLRQNVAEAQAMGLALIVGLNITKGSPAKGEVSASQIESWGTTLLSSSYPCAFISWQYNGRHLGRADVKAAMTLLAEVAGSRPSRSCRGVGAQVSEEPETPPTEEPETPPTEEPELPPEEGQPPQDSVPQAPPDSTGGEPPSTDSSSVQLQLSVTGWAERGRHYMRLTWSGAQGANVDLYRDGEFKRTTRNDGRALSTRLVQEAGTYSFQVCEEGTSVCSNTATVSFEAPSARLTVQATGTGAGRRVTLRWSQLPGRTVDIYRNGALLTRSGNDGFYANTVRADRSAAYRYQVCQTGTSSCSNVSTISF